MRNSDKITYDEYKKMLDFFEQNGVPLIDLVYPLSKKHSEWPTIGDFRKAVIGLGLKFKDAQISSSSGISESS